MEERKPPLPPRGLELRTEDQSKDVQEETTAGEEILSPEQFAQRFGNIKVRYSVNGEEVVREAPEILKRDQLYSGRERVIEAKNTEASRLLDETRQLHRDVMQSRTVIPVVEKPADPDDPKAFVSNVVKEEVGPQIKQLTDAVLSLKNEIAPTLVTSRFGQGKEVVSRFGVDTSDYDTRKDDMLKVFEKSLGRPVQPNEVGQITPQLWSEAYLVVKATSPVAPKKAEEKPKVVVTRVAENTEPPKSPHAGSQAGPLSRGINDVLTGKKTWAEHLGTKIKPLSVRTG